MENEKKLRNEIFDKVKRIYELRKENNKFIPGKSYVNYAGRVFDEKELVNLVDASLDFWLTTGRYAQKFEERFAKFLGVKYCVLTNSGSSANLLAVSALTSPLLGNKRLKPGDEVITIPCGFPTTLNPIIQNNLVPVFIDIELGTYNVRADDIEKAVSRKTKAIFLPHTLGIPAEIDKIVRVAKKHGLWYIEDNCDSLGSKYNGRYTGTFGDIATSSFYPPHHITMGEGGAVVTDDPMLRRIILSFRDWGRDCWCDSGKDNSCGKRFKWKIGDLPFGYDHKYIYSHIGYNLKLTDMQAAIGCSQLEKLPGFINARKKNFSILDKALRKYDDCLIFPEKTKGSDPSWFGYTILVRPDAPFTRSDLVNFLENNKIATRMLFGGNLLKQPAYKDIKCRIYKGLKNTDLVMNNLFWIGVYPGINKGKLDYVINMFEHFFNSLSERGVK